jgi:hypothetical protein
MQWSRPRFVRIIKFQKIGLNYLNAWHICRLLEIDFQLQESNLW